MTWRTLHNEELRKGTACRILVGNPEGEGPIRSLRRRWENIIKLDFREMGWYGMDWIDLVQNRDRRGPHVSAVLKL
jgi:hypothetical protein